MISDSRDSLHPGLSPDGPKLTDEGDKRYALGAVIGHGGIGTVQLAADRQLRRTVALKTLRDHHAAEPIMRRAFVEEAVITGALDHPNIVPVYDAGSSEVFGPYYTMKRLEGEPLDRILDRRKRGAEEPRLPRLLEYFAQILRAIVFCHERGVVHCDLKPANIIIGPLGEVWVSDWGLAKVLGAGGKAQARRELWSGSPGYMSPEQASGSDPDILDERADIWSLGVLLYELLTTELPMPRASSGVGGPFVWEDFPSPARRAPNRRIPRELDELTMRALARRPEDRPPSVRDLLEGVEAYLDGRREARLREETISRHVQRIDPLLDEASEGRLAAVDAASQAIERAFDGKLDSLRLRTRAAELYWTSFRALNAAGESQAPTFVAIMNDMMKLAPEAVVAAAAAGTGESSPEDVLGDERWLQAVERVATSNGRRPLPRPVAELLERIAHLKRISLFADVPAHALVSMALALSQEHYTDGEVLFSYGDEANALYLLSSGRIEIAINDTVLNTLDAPSCFGEVALIDGNTRTAAARAKGTTSCWVLGHEHFEAAMLDPMVSRRVAGVLASRLRMATKREFGS